MTVCAWCQTNEATQTVITHRHPLEGGMGWAVCRFEVCVWCSLLCDSLCRFAKDGVLPTW